MDAYDHGGKNEDDNSHDNNHEDVVQPVFPHQLLANTALGHAHRRTAPSRSRIDASKLNLSRWIVITALSTSSRVASPFISLSNTAKAASAVSRSGKL